MDPFVPGDLLRNPLYPGAVYLVVLFDENDTPLRLVRLRGIHAETPMLLCKEGADGAWTYSEGLRERGFVKIGHLDLRTVK